MNSIQRKQEWTLVYLIGVVASLQETLLDLRIAGELTICGYLLKEDSPQIAVVLVSLITARCPIVILQVVVADSGQNGNPWEI